jgi:ion channel
LLFLAAATGVSVLLSVGIPELWARYLTPNAVDVPLSYEILSFLGFVGFAAPFAMMIIEIRRTIAPIRPGLASYVLWTYACAAVSFAGLYYNLNFWGDFEDAIAKYNFYTASSLRQPTERRETLAIPDRRSFGGLQARLWSSADYQISREAVNPFAQNLDTPEELAKQPIEKVVRFLGNARLTTFLDCLHFSVVTMATVGFGDIVPKTTPAKLIVDLQICVAVFLLSVALQRAMQNRNHN